MRRERNATTDSRSSRQSEVAARRRLAQCQCAVGHHGQRRQGVLLDQCRGHRSPRLGKRARRSGSCRARHSRRHRRHDRLDRRAQAGCRAATAPPRPGRAARLLAQAAAKSGIADVKAVGNPRCRGRDRGGLRQGRRRKIDHGAQSRLGPARSRFARRPARRRHLRAVGAQADRHSREAAAQRRPENDSASAFRPCDHVDRFSGRRGYRDDLARADGDVGHHPDAARCRVGHA